VGIIEIFAIIKDELYGGIVMSKPWYMHISNGLVLQNPFYGGSFKQHTHIAGISDIDTYFIYLYGKLDLPYDTTSYICPSILDIDRVNAHKLNYEDEITGKILLDTCYYQLKKLEHNSLDWTGRRPKNQIRVEFQWGPPYRHAIPIRVYFRGLTYLMDCIPALKLNNNNDLLIPNTEEDTTKVNPTKLSNALKKLNRKNDGKGSKLIRLLKYWNERWNHDLKSYLLERLVMKVFQKKSIEKWDATLKVFFPEAINIIKQRIHIPNMVYTNESILDEYSSEELDTMEQTLRNANSYVQKNNFEALFGKL
jgi:hypothetical protein